MDNPIISHIFNTDIQSIVACKTGSQHGSLLDLANNLWSTHYELLDITYGHHIIRKLIVIKAIWILKQNVPNKEKKNLVDNFVSELTLLKLSGVSFFKKVDNLTIIDHIIRNCGLIVTIIPDIPKIDYISSLYDLRYLSQYANNKLYDIMPDQFTIQICNCLYFNSCKISEYIWTDQMFTTRQLEIFANKLIFGAFIKHYIRTIDELIKKISDIKGNY